MAIVMPRQSDHLLFPWLKWTCPSAPWVANATDSEGAGVHTISIENRTTGTNGGACEHALGMESQLARFGRRFVMRAKGAIGVSTCLLDRGAGWCGASRKDMRPATAS
jgi:hypothetical protein